MKMKVEIRDGVLMKMKAEIRGWGVNENES